MTGPETPATPSRRRDEMRSPVELDAPVQLGGSPLGWASGTIATAALLLALTNAVSIDDWAAEQEPSPTMARVTAATEWWRATSDAIGLGAPRAATHGTWKRLQAARFAGQAPAGELEGSEP